MFIVTLNVCIAKPNEYRVILGHRALPSPIESCLSHSVLKSSSYHGVRLHSDVDANRHSRHHAREEPAPAQLSEIAANGLGTPSTSFNSPNDTSINGFTRARTCRTATKMAIETTFH